MADKRIDQLTEASSLTAVDLMVTEQSGVAKKVTGDILANSAWNMMQKDATPTEDSTAPITSGAVAAAIAENIDDTLSVQGKAADAKAAGDAVGELKSAIDDLPDLVDRKAGMLVDTASGAIATFVPDSTIDNLLGVSVAVEPVQDLHGYDSPWPSGGGKNLFDSSVFPSSSSQNIIYLHYAVQNGAYTMSTPDFPLVGGIANVFFLAGSVSSGISSGSNGVVQSAPRTITVTDGYYTVAYRSTNDINTNNPKDFKWQIESGNSATSYSPYSNICPISGWTGAEVTRTGVNVCDEVFELGAIVNGNNYSSNNNLRTKNYIPVVGGQTFYSTCPSDIILFQYDKDKTLILQGNTPFITVSSGASFVVTAGTRFIRFYTQPAYGTTYNNDISINYPATDHNYHAYSGNTYTIQLGQTVYGGTLDVTSGKLTVDRAIVDLGTLTWNKRSTAESGKYRFGAGLPGGTRQDSGTVIPNMLCSVYKTITPNFSYLTRTGITNDIARNPLVNVYDPAFISATAADFKTAMSGVQLCYELATPIEIQLDPVTIATIANQTNNVWADAGDVAVEFAADLKAYIDRLNQPTEDDMIANTLIQSGKYFTVNNRLFLSTASIAAGAQIIPGTNCTETSLAAALNALNA